MRLPASLIETRGTTGSTHGSACIDWKFWKRVETTGTFTDVPAGVKTLGVIRAFFPMTS